MKLLSALRNLFRRTTHQKSPAAVEPRTLDGVPASGIRVGDRLQWTESDGRTMTGTVTDRYGCLMVQTDAIRYVSLQTVIGKSIFYDKETI